jgi:methylated-DNA-[protein]-cysteine S-methyltransferase
MTTTDNPLTALRDVDETTLRRLRGALAEKAAEARLLDLAYRRIDSPVGQLLLVATERGLIRVAFESQDHDRVLAQLAATVSPRVLEAPQRLDPAARELAEYFDGTRQVFDLPLDLSTTGEFRRTVQLLLPSVGYGHTVSYTELATLAGRPTAVRAVGTACATNPLPVVVPCHRVLRGDGSLGGYLGGLDAKRTLLDLERRMAA